MIQEIRYIAEDGKRFDTEIECRNYERELRKKHNNAVLVAAKEIDNSLWLEHFGETGKEPELYQAYLWLENDIPAIVLRSKKRPTLEAIKNIILDTEYGEEICTHIPFDRIEKEINVRSNWLEALKSVKNGADLSGIIQWGFHPDDIKQLALLHKSNKCRRKIEDLLTDCNFHTECGDFYNKRYEKYI